MSQSTLLYDETCGFCTSIVQWIARQKRGNAIAIMPCQFAQLTGKFPVTQQDCLTSIQLYDADGAVTTRGDAVAKVLGTLWDSPWPTRIGGLPIIRQVMNLGYMFIAKNRHRLPGIKQMCASGEGSSCGVKQ